MTRVASLPWRFPWRLRLAESPRWLALQGVLHTHPRRLALVTLLALLSALAPTAFSLATGALVSLLTAPMGSATEARRGPDAFATQATAIAWWVALLGALFVAQQLLGALQGIAIDSLARRYMGGVYRAVMRAALRPATVLHFEDSHLQDLIDQARNDGWTGPRAAVNGLFGWAIERFRGAAGLLIVAHFSPWLALLLAAAWLHHLRRLQGLHDELIAMRFRRTEDMREVDYQAGILTGDIYAKEVRVFDLVRWFAGRYETSWRAAMAGLQARRREQVPLVIVATLPVLAIEALAFWLIGRAVVVYAHAVFESHRLGVVSETEVQLKYGTSGLKPLRELQRLVQEDPRLVLPGHRPADDLPRHHIRFEDVAFRYPGQGEDVFRGLTLEIPAGRSLALVGANGAGKTTLVKLLARLYDPTEGRITVDGVDIKEIDPHAWQRRVAAIFQEFVKYELPAHENVAFGAVERLRDRGLAREAARRAGALEIIESLPHGWDTILSRRYTGGADLSGGQWQRVALARALFAASAGASVLIMDEPTAHLDVRAEAAFYDSFLDLTAGLTTVVISHRFSTVRRAQHIVVLDRGGVLEQGTHDDLLAAGGTYARMFTLQAQRFTGADGAATVSP